MPVTQKNRSYLRREAEALAAPYPPLLAEAERVAAVVAQGVHGRRKSGQGETFWQYRNYTSSDSTTDIDWRRSARSDHYYVRKNEWEAANTVWLWRDGASGMDWRSDTILPTKQDRISVLLIALSALLIRAGERCAVMGESECPRSGRPGLERIAARLSYGPGEITSLDSPFAAHAKLVLASDFLDPSDAWRQRLARLSARPASGVLLHVVDPAERTFPYRGRMKLLKPGETTARFPFLLDRAEKAKSEYIRKFKAHETMLADTARRLGWILVTHQTDQPAAQALTTLYHALVGDS